ncbi:MAG: TatD family hydrolase [Culicoidibacterales bacterium]
MFFDTHCHLNAPQLLADVHTIIDTAAEKGVDTILVVGFDRQTIIDALALAEEYDHIYAAVGWHPVDAIDCTSADLQWIESLLTHPKVVAVGEIGLDYHWDKSPHDKQQYLLEKQLELAIKYDLPVIIHDREAHQPIYETLKKYTQKGLRGVMHSYSASSEMVKAFTDLGFMISLSGVVTFKNAKTPKKVAKETPLEHLLIETDAPYLTPHPYRGKRNEPAYVTLVAQEIADLKGISVEEVGVVTAANAKRLFGIDT